MTLPSWTRPHQILFLFGALLLLVALFSWNESQGRSSLETVRSLPGFALPSSPTP